MSLGEAKRPHTSQFGLNFPIRNLPAYLSGAIEVLTAN